MNIIQKTNDFDPHQLECGRILLLEDNDANRQMMSDFLTYCGYCVSSIGRGQDLFEAIATLKPDVILLDLKLPDISGFTLLQELQSHEQWSKIPVIVVSAFAFRSDQQRALHLGAQDYLVKPIDLQRLLTVIQASVLVPKPDKPDLSSDAHPLGDYSDNSQN